MKKSNNFFLDLQFQLIFGNPGNPIINSSSDSSPDDSKPKVINILIYLHHYNSNDIAY